MEFTYKRGLHLVPAHMRDAVSRYVELGIGGGSFLTAILSNDFSKTLSRADEINRNSLLRWAEFIHLYMPISAWGSPDAVAKWCKAGGLHGIIGKEESEEEENVEKTE